MPGQMRSFGLDFDEALAVVEMVRADPEFPSFLSEQDRADLVNEAQRQIMHVALDAVVRVIPPPKLERKLKLVEKMK